MKNRNKSPTFGELLIEGMKEAVEHNRRMKMIRYDGSRTDSQTKIDADMIRRMMPNVQLWGCQDYRAVKVMPRWLREFMSLNQRGVVIRRPNEASEDSPCYCVTAVLDWSDQFDIAVAPSLQSAFDWIADQFGPDYTMITLDDPVEFEDRYGTWHFVAHSEFSHPVAFFVTVDGRYKDLVD